MMDMGHDSKHYVGYVFVNAKFFHEELDGAG